MIDIGQVEAGNLVKKVEGKVIIVARVTAILTDKLVKNVCLIVKCPGTKYESFVSLPVDYLDVITDPEEEAMYTLAGY